jgi:formylglycine-generating enzyme required for sulfatase activity
MGSNPSKWVGLRNAVEMTSWHDAKEFCKKVTAELRQRKLIKDDDEIRLPTEVHWEYACRAGTKGAWSFGDDLSELTHYCWYKDNSKGHDPPVGAKKPNPWGLYDMHGYNWEWCDDDWHPTYEGVGAGRAGEGRRVAGAKDRVIRGGSWHHSADQSRSAFRGHAPADERNDKIGFRCVKLRAKQGGSDAE